MILDSKPTEVAELHPGWHEAIPNDCSLQASVATYFIEGELHFAYSNEVQSDFMLETLTNEQIEEWVGVFAVPFAVKVDEVFREKHDISDDWVVDSRVFARRGLGNLSHSRETVEVAQKCEPVCKDGVAEAGVAHFDFMVGSTKPINLYSASRDGGTVFIDGLVESFFDDVTDIESATRLLETMFGNEQGAIDPYSQQARDWYWSIRDFRDINYRRQIDGESVLEVQSKPDVLYDATGTVHWKPALDFEAQDRVFAKAMPAKIMRVDSLEFQGLFSGSSEIDVSTAQFI